jgi:hypothetical protein
MVGVATHMCGGRQRADSGEWMVCRLVYVIPIIPLIQTIQVVLTPWSSPPPRRPMMAVTWRMASRWRGALL